MSESQIQQKTAQEEFEMIISDKGDFQEMQQYLDPVIRKAIQKKKFGFSDETKERLYNEIVKDIPIATNRFVANKKQIDENIKFSVYFTWYIAQRINTELNKRTFWSKIKAALRGF